MLADQKGITRFVATPASTNQQIWYSGTVTLPRGWQVSSHTRRWVYETQNPVVLDTNNIYAVYITADELFVNDRTCQFETVQYTIPNIGTIFEQLSYLAGLLQLAGWNATVYAADDHSEMNLPYNFGNIPVLFASTEQIQQIVPSNWSGLNHPVLCKRAMFYRQEPTSENLDAGDITTIVKKTNNVWKTTNVSMSYRGRLRESNTELRERMIKYIITGKATIPMIEFFIINGVLDVNYVRVLPVRQMINGDYFNGIKIVVDGGIEEDIINAIADSKAAGIPTFKSETDQNIKGGWHDATQEEIWYSIPGLVEIEFKIKYSFNPYEGLQIGYETSVRIALEQAINSMSFGSSIIANRFLQILYSFPGFGPSTMQISIKGSGVWSDELKIPEGSRVMVGVDDIYWEYTPQ